MFRHLLTPLFTQAATNADGVLNALEVAAAKDSAKSFAAGMRKAH